MSGAEGLVLLSVAANVLQFVEFATELCGRIRDYSNGPGMPRKLAALADQLADLVAIIKSRSNSLDTDPLEEHVAQRCLAQAQELSLLLESLKGSKKDQDHWWKNARKALKSLSRAEKIEELQSTLNNLINTLSLQLLMKTRLAPRRPVGQISHYPAEVVFITISFHCSISLIGGRFVNSDIELIMVVMDFD